VLNEGHDFKREVRRIARLLGSEDAFSGAAIIAGRERDEFFETRDTLNIVESTISTRKDKAIDDAKKTAGTVQKLRKSSAKHVNGWLAASHRTPIRLLGTPLEYFDRFCIGRCRCTRSRQRDDP
jgi:hypothetical protein